MVDDGGNFEAFRDAFARDGLRAAITYLNSLTPHRFTSMMRLGDEMSRSVVFVDHDNPDHRTTLEVPTMATYCVFVRETLAPFLVIDSTTDQRVAGHPKQNEVRSYCGVPLVGRDGKVFGSLCHFDTKSVPISQEMVDLMERVAPMLEASFKA